MTPDDAFLQAILEQPEDDGPRLMYADWLSERGDERGEFIRVQCELAHTPEDHPHRAHWEAIERDLLTRHRNAWLGPLRSLAYRWEFSRGFPEEAAVEAAAFLAHAHLFFSQTPLRVVRMLHARGSLRELANCSALERLTALHLTDNGIGDEGVERLAASRHLHRLTALRLGNNQLDDVAAYALAQSPYLGRLTTLNLSNNHLGDAGAGYLASSPYLPNLTALHLGNNSIGSEGVERLLASSYLQRLETLDLANHNVAWAAVNRVPPSYRSKLVERFPTAVVSC